MNIFALHMDSAQAARWHCDAHVVKMVLESAQLLCTTHHLMGSPAPYRPTHVNHPCAAWARASRGNYTWLASLGRELCREYAARYMKIHATSRVLRDLATNVPDLPDLGLTPFAQAMPIEHQGPDPIVAYRDYYQTKRGVRLGKWKRNKPDWWLDD